MRENQPSTVTSRDWTLLYSVAGEEVELYDRIADPNFENNVYLQKREIASAMHGQLLNFLRSLGTDEVFLEPRKSLS